ncbi:hypothetical protein BS50DRAFT_634671 [Corynespora cassiicola Philippines]|uniref:Uncharacterized protein n=1 Tax=Corynespora cassiicola Philippines TaxID=1448308 RepID=A0A2T2NPV2_CORCC|nr:hypothetical protein BS50DRAFT_634671 [Corynespora cassiicola Philippines]
MAKKSLSDQAYEMMNGQQPWNQCLDCAFKIPREYFPPSAIGTSMKCPLCSVKYYIKRVKTIQANMAQRGGIICSKSRISYTERGTHYAHDPEFKAHKYLKLQWSRVKKMSLKNLARWENRLEKRMRRLDGKPLNPEWQNMADAVDLYYREAEELAYVPGFPYEEEAEAEANYIEATVKEVTAWWNSKHSIPKSEAPRTSTVWYRARKEQMAQGSPTYLVATLKSCLRRRRKSDPPIASSANRKFHIDNPGTVRTAIRFNDKVEVCSDALTFEPDPFPLRSKINITPNFWILPSSPPPTLSASTTFIPFRDPFSSVRYRPKSRFTRKRKVYRPGAWASPEGYEKINTSFYKISLCELVSSDDLGERELQLKVRSRLNDIARYWVEGVEARKNHWV